LFGKMGDMMKQMQLMQKLMKDDNFKALMAHPKVQELLKDPEFREAIKGQDFSALQSHPKFSGVMSDPELVKLISKLNLQDLMKGEEGAA